MIHKNVKQWWMQALLVLLTSLTFGFSFDSSLDYPVFTDLQNDTENDDSSLAFELIDKFNNKKTCQEFWSCHNAESNFSTVHNGFCYCDELCTLFDDCCEGKFITSLTAEIGNRFAFKNRKRNKDGIGKTKSKMNAKYESRLDKNLYKCSFSYYQNDFMYTIIACPKEYTNPEVRQKCERPQKTDRLLHVPVSGFFPGFKDGAPPIKFYNLYCALCHNISAYEFWQPKYQCYNSSESFPEKKELLGSYSEYNYSIEVIENDFKCKQILFFNPLEIKVRSCSPSSYVCPKEKSEELKLLCSQGPFHPVFLPNAGNKIYRNTHCAFCNNVKFEELSCNASQYRHPNFHTYETEMLGLSKLYNFNIFKKACGKHAIYDFYKDSCRPIFSPKSNACEENDLNRHDPTVACPTCQLIELDENEYSQSGDSIYFPKSELTVNKSLLHFIDNKPYICVEDYTANQFSQSTTLFDKIEVYITIIGLTLSILALLLTFGVYSCFRSLRNVPGKMSMNLVASMFLASLLFIFSNDKLVDIICIIVAVCMHYVYLVSFFWMNALSFDAWNTFSKTSIGGRSKNTYKYYLIYCWMTPLLIVSVSIFVQFSRIDIFPLWLSPNYGPPFCWISNKWSLLIFFVAPLFLLILCNLVFYGLTIRAIYRTERFSNRLLSKKNKGMFLIYLKLCFIMGMTWLFALLHTFTGIKIISYLSVFLNSFQGFWVGCSYLFSKQVCRNFKGKIPFFGRRHPMSEETESKQTSAVYISNTKSIS